MEGLPWGKGRVPGPLELTVLTERGWPLPRERWDWWFGETQPQDLTELPPYKHPLFPSRGWGEARDGRVVDKKTLPEVSSPSRFKPD